MGVRPWSRRARAHALAGIDPAQRPARDEQTMDLRQDAEERAAWSRRARAHALAGIDPAQRPARHEQTMDLRQAAKEQAASGPEVCVFVRINAADCRI